ncbi:MAG TPA: zinc-binding dehydrogenase [Ureibacillus sp.]|uniref:quinone oxidoreductase family protein n=1 Tax=Peribacillus asahii TaxID=228899 RepID=UPI00207992E0|nr:zinc-binding dehydrogenase [Peribacillus asahii]USK60858.1 zinc-binding dehydrogenase [Peribacillus asahii]HWL26915.1 zinc-binding dehydrogenase [Ureibacillus sp.]
MKAIVLRELGGPTQLRYEDVEVPTPKANEVLVKLKYASLNRRDLWITYGQYPGMELPSILGADGAGEVVAVGEQVSDIKVGSAVVINPALNWGESRAFHGPDHRILGMPSDGTYAEYVVVPAENVFTKPTYLSWEEAAALPLAGVTAFRSLMYRGNLKKGENVLIPGIGSGVALLALQIAVAQGANVFVTSSSDEKLERAKQLGAKGGVNYRSENWVKEMKKLMDGADLIIDSVGGENFNHLINLAKPGGRIVNFGATSGTVKELLLPRIFFKHLDIKGSTMGSPEDFKEMLQFFEEHKISPYVDKCYPLKEAIEALIYMENAVNFGKITLKIE